jgi:hypothetical protein
MNDTVNHPPDLGSVWQRQGLMESFESKAPEGLSLIAGSPDRTPNPIGGYRFLHVWLPLSSPSPVHASYQQPPQEPSID